MINYLYTHKDLFYVRRRETDATISTKLDRDQASLLAHHERLPVSVQLKRWRAYTASSQQLEVWDGFIGTKSLICLRRHCFNLRPCERQQDRFGAVRVGILSNQWMAYLSRAQGQILESEHSSAGAQGCDRKGERERERLGGKKQS